MLGSGGGLSVISPVLGLVVISPVLGLVTPPASVDVNGPSLGLVTPPASVIIAASKAVLDGSG